MPALRTPLGWHHLLLLLFTGAAIGVQPPTGRFVISGRVVDPLHLRPEGAILTLGRQDDAGGVSQTTLHVKADGAFATDPLPPGAYVLEIIRTPHSATKAATLVGLSIVKVAAANVSNVTVSIRRDTALTGRFRMVSDDPSAPWPPQIVVITGLALNGAPLWPNGGGVEGAPGGRFILHNAFGPRVLRCGYRLEGGNFWWPTRVLLDGKDVTNVPTDFSEREGADLEVLFSKHRTGFTGTVVTADGQPATGAWVVVAPSDLEQRQLWATTSHTVRTDNLGAFRVLTLPGRYVLQAFQPDMFFSRSNAWRLFAKLGPAAAFANLREREQRRIRLTTGGR